MKKIMLIAITALIVLSACNNPDNINQESTSQTTSAGADNNNAQANITESTTQDPAYQYGGEKLDFGGETFTFLYPKGWALYQDYYFVEEETGDAVNDALYRRVLDTEEYFNIKINTVDIGTDIDGIAPKIYKDVRAGINSYDLVLTHCISGLDYIVEKNLAYNWLEMPNVDLSKKYWNQSMQEYLNINGYMPFAANDFIIPDPCFITFSKDLLQQYNLENPYELVKSGKWTLDKLIEMSKQVSKDINGDGKYTQEDLYGFVGEISWMFTHAMYACDQRTVRKDEDGHYALDLNTAKTKTIVEKFYDLIYTGNQAFVYNQDAKANGQPYIAFDSGRALFYMNVPSYVKELRATDFDFGILPYPKYDEAQEKYITLNWAGTMTAPININNPEKVGAVAEYLGAISHETVMPAYFDILLNGKVTRDEESREMLDIIYGDNTYDFGLNFSAHNDLFYIVFHLLKDEKSTDVTSYYEKRAAKIQKQYDKVYNAYIKNSET